jgi:hypothetical protein
MNAYDLINISSIGIILLTKNIPFLFLYTICDLIYILMTSVHRPRRKNQLVFHHIAALLMVLKAPAYSETDYISKTMNIEISTFLILLSKHVNLSWIPMVIWFYFRVIYFPLLAVKIRTYHACDYILYISTNIVESLGLMWTLESIRVPRRLYRPCCVSMVYAVVPFFTKCIENKMYPEAVHSLCLLASSLVHHTNHIVKSPQYWVDKFFILSCSIHVALISKNNYFRLVAAPISYGIFQFTKSMRQEDSHRDWDNLPNVLVHMAVHAIMGHGMFYSVFTN